MREKMGRSSLRTRGPNDRSDSFGYHHTDWWQVLAVTDVTIDCGKLNDDIGRADSHFGRKFIVPPEPRSQTIRLLGPIPVH